MNEKEPEEIRIMIEDNIREIAGNSGYSYLNSYNEQWRDANDYVHELEDMDTRYLNNCLREIKRASKFINLRFENITKIIDLSKYNLNEEYKSRIIYIGKCCLRDAFNEKKGEIESELLTR